MAAKRRTIIKEDLNIGYGPTTIPTDSGGMRAANKLGIHAFTAWTYAADHGVSTSASASDNATYLQTALNTGLPVLLPIGTINYSVQVYPGANGQVIQGAGKALTILNFTGTGFAFAFNDRSKCMLRDLQLTSADEGIDFKITSGNCTNNVVDNCLINGPGRGATAATSTRRGIVFRRMSGSLAVFFNTVINTIIQNFDRAVDFDAAAGSPTLGGNANQCINVHVEHCWFGYYVQCIENTIIGGFFNQTGGNSASDYFTGYRFTNSASRNNVVPSIGEPGANSKPYQFDAGTTVNRFEYIPFNYDLSGTDAGTETTGFRNVQFRQAGTYTPTFTGITNIASITGYAAQYSRQDDMVTVSGQVAIDPTAASALTELELTLPVATTWTLAEQCGGIAFSDTLFGSGARIYGNASTNRARIGFTTTTEHASRTWSFIFMYRVIA